MTSQEIIDLSIAREQAERVKKAKHSWWPSELGQCLRGAYYKRLGMPAAEPDERLLRVFKVGTLDEEFVASCFKSLPELRVQQQVPITLSDYDLTGYADMVVTFPDGNDVPYELKSCHSQKFWRMNKEGRQGDQHHRMQLWCALKALGRPTGCLVYVSKDDLSIAEYLVTLDDLELSESVLGELSLLNEAWSKKDPSILPLVDPILTNEFTGKKTINWKAEYCNYHTYCTQDEHWHEKALASLKK